MNQDQITLSLKSQSPIITHTKGGMYKLVSTVEGKGYPIRFLYKDYDLSLNILYKAHGEWFDDCIYVKGSEYFWGGDSEGTSWVLYQDIKTLKLYARHPTDFGAFTNIL